MQFSKPVGAGRQKGPPGGNPNGPKMDFSYEFLTPADSVLQSEQSI
jgi:hypothetical protein